MTITLSSTQWQQLETIVLDEYMALAIVAWEDVYRGRWRRHFAPLPHEKLHYYGRETVKACERRGIELRHTVVPLQFLVWHAVLLGFADRFIADCLHHVLDECNGNDFGLSWLELFLAGAERSLGQGDGA